MESKKTKFALTQKLNVTQGKMQSRVYCRAVNLFKFADTSFASRSIETKYFDFTLLGCLYSNLSLPETLYDFTSMKGFL